MNKLIATRFLSSLALLVISAALIWGTQASAAHPQDDLIPSYTPTATTTASPESTATSTSSPTPTTAVTETVTPTHTATATLAATSIPTPAATPGAYFSYLPALADIPPPSPKGCEPLPSIPGTLTSTEHEIEDLINAYRQANGVARLNVMPHLTQAARSHAWDMAANGFADNVGTDGSTVGERTYGACYDWVYVGQILGVNHSAHSMLRGWTSQKKSLDLILSPHFLDFGAAYVYDEDSLHQHYWVVVFGRHASAGVVIDEGEQMRRGASP